MKKLLTAVLALVMVICMTVPAFAATVTITEPEGVEDTEYAGYMILNATNDAADTTKFAYTLNKKYEAVLKIVTEKTTEADIVKYISELDEAGMRAFANALYAEIAAAKLTADQVLKTGKNTVENEGYWLIAQTKDAAEGETESLVIIDTTGKDNIEIVTKKDTVEVTKKVSDEGYLTCEETAEDHVHGKDCYNWKDANEAALGDTVSYDIKTEVPSTAAGYKDDYYFIISDTLSAGLTLNADSVEVFIGGEKAKKDVDYSLVVKDQNFKVALINAKAQAGKAVEVYYTAVLNTEAIIGVAGNKNEVDVTYSRDPNWEDDGTPDKVPGIPNEEKNVPTGTTPKDDTMTYVTGIKLLKVDGNTKQPLKDAEFTISGDSLNIVLKYVETFTKDAKGEYYLLKNGAYTKQAPKTEDTMDPAEDRKGGYVVAEDEYKGDTVTVGGVLYRKANQTDLDNNDIALFILNKKNVDSYKEPITDKYALTGKWVNESAKTEKKLSASVNEDGIVVFAGLGEGTYTVSETKVPAGYNKIDDFTVEIKFNDPTLEDNEGKDIWEGTVADEKLALVDMGDDDTVDESEVFEITVNNYSGVELPSTGGIGTRIFYIGGGVLVLAAVVLLITKKRMNNRA